MLNQSIKGLICGGPYHPIPLLEKDQYERIRQMKLIIYHTTTCTWVDNIGGMDGVGVLS
jgi:hypothetical protein